MSGCNSHRYVRLPNVNGVSNDQKHQHTLRLGSPIACEIQRFEYQMYECRFALGDTGDTTIGKNRKEQYQVNKGDVAYVGTGGFSETGLSITEREEFEVEVVA